MRKFVVFAGPNGSGKTTIINEFLKANDMVYVCPDKFPREKYAGHYIDAAQEAERMVLYYFSIGASVAFETVLSSDYKWYLFDWAQKFEYEIIVYFISTNDAHINVQRVQERVNAGGHFVPEEKIISRYEKSLANLHKLLNYSNYGLVYDNSSDKPILLLYKENQVYSVKIAVINTQMFSWLKKQLNSWLSSGLINASQVSYKE